MSAHFSPDWLTVLYAVLHSVNITVTCDSASPLCKDSGLNKRAAFKEIAVWKVLSLAVSRFRLPESYVIFDCLFTELFVSHQQTVEGYGSIQKEAVKEAGGSIFVGNG